MSEAVTVRHVRFSGNWEALYVDGEKVASNHTIDVGDVLNALEDHQLGETSSERRDVNLKGRDPERYEDIPDE